MKAKTRFFSLIVIVFFIHLVCVSIAAAATRIMPLGDSITKGSNGVIQPEEMVGYRQNLYLDLTDEGYDVDFVGGEQEGESAVPAFDIDHEGHGGWQASGGIEGGLVPNVFDWLIVNPADIVLLHIGTNDISAGDSPAEIVSEVDQILDQIFQYDTETIVILARIINRQVYNQNTNDFNNLLPDMVNEHPNLDNIFLVNQEIALDYATDMEDDLHPNDDGYDKMADLWYSALQEILSAADAGSNQSVNAGETVTLDGSDSKEPVNPDYFWEQTEGTPVTISDTTVVQPTFIAPDVGSQQQTLTFRLTVSSSNGLESTDTTNVEVNGSSSSSSSGGCFIGTITE